MKRHNVIICTLGSIAILAVSCNSDILLDTNSEDQELHTYTLYLDTDVPCFESGHERETRASGSNWEDGDVIFISFSNNGSTSVKKATYRSNLGAFQMIGYLSPISDASCSVYYFRDGNVSDEASTVSMDQYTAIFVDTDAKYTSYNYHITLNAAFKPYTWRLCFKGDKGTKVNILPSFDIIYNTRANIIDGTFTTRNGFVNLSINSDGYTPYIYGQFSETINEIQIEVDGIVYTRKFDSTKLIKGESGYFTIPNSSDPHGWTKTDATTGTINGHGYVDLGLPSGTLWAYCNIGAFYAEDYGGYYAWGETEEKDYYDWSTYTHCDGSSSSFHYIGDNIAGTEYDVAHVKWGDSWQIPTINQIKELIKNCTAIWMTQNGVDGTLVTGPNGSSIFLPAAGYHTGPFLGSDGKAGEYWSSSSSETRVYEAYQLDSNSKYFEISTFHEVTYGLSVRPVISPNNHHYCPDDNHPHMIDLGLSSGTKWACCNVDATKPEGYGGYYAWGETATKDNYEWSTYTYCDGTSSSTHHIGDDIASSEYDVAHVKWGSTWQMPTVDQNQELCKNCSWNWTTLNGVNGLLVTGPNGNSIFLPAAGFYNSYGLGDEGELGSYWSSTLGPNDDYHAYDFGFNSSYWGGDSWSYLSDGHSVRAVCK